MDEILRMVKGLQTSEEHKVALPANWPNSELFGADVIIPPAKDVATIKAVSYTHLDVYKRQIFFFVKNGSAQCQPARTITP